MWKQFIRDYLSFTKKDRIGIFILIALITFCLIAPFLYPYFIHTKEYDHSQFDKEISKLKFQQVDSATDKDYNNKNFDENNYANYYEPSEKKYYPGTKRELFYFDPNTASLNEWKRLGIKDKTAETIKKYLSKGGHFYKPEDIKKIWGLHKDDVEHLLPYVRITGSKKKFSDNKVDFQNNSSGYKKPSPYVIDINTGDTTAFISLPGIGSKLAQRIVSFRDKLGGFYSVDQIKETYALPDSTFQKIRSKLVLNHTSVKQLNINTATLEEIKSHPYLRFNIANAIVQYRNQHGNFSSVSDIKKIMIITDDVFNKVAPYLTVN